MNREVAVMETEMLTHTELKQAYLLANKELVAAWDTIDALKSDIADLDAAVSVSAVAEDVYLHDILGGKRVA